MIRALYTAASGMSAQQANLDTVANNLANSATAGFRSRKMQFEDMIYQNLVMPGSASSTSTTSAGLQIGLGTKSTASEVIMTQGDFNQTGNTLDLAIQGAGFFQVQLPNGTIAYTRDGNFSMNNAGDGDGRQRQPTAAGADDPIERDESVTISQYGVVSATLPGQTASSQLGTIQLATFPNPGGLNSLGGNLLQPTSSSGNAITDVPGGKQRDGDAAAGISGELERGCGGRVRAT